MGWMIAGLLGLGAQDGAALCRYLPESNTIWVHDYPADMPCTPALLLRTDRMFEWGLVEYAPESDTYTINANLRLGYNDGADTFFQIGSREHPRETLVLKGNLVLYPEFFGGQNRHRRGINRLTIGVKDDPSVRAALKFHNEPGQYHTLLSGAYYEGADRPTKKGSYGGQLHVYHSLITAAIQDRPHAIGAAGNRHFYIPGAYGYVALRQATISWVAGVIAFGMTAKCSDVADSIFEHSGYALINSEQAAVNCIFRNLKTAIMDWGGPLDALLTNCRFEDNDANWSLSRGRLRCVDCVFGAPKKGNIYKSWPEQQAGTKPYAYFESSRHVMVRVQDRQGEPIAGARIEVTTALNPLERKIVFTGNDGQTPGQGTEGALLLIERRETATAVENSPEIVDFTYDLAVTASNRQNAIVSNLAPTQSWMMVTVALD